MLQLQSTSELETGFCSSRCNPIINIRKQHNRCWGAGGCLMWAIVQKCWSRRRYKSLLLLVLCAWTARLGDFQAYWVHEFLLMTLKRFRTEAVTSTGISRRKTLSLRLSVSILYFVNIYGDVKVILKHYISMLLLCSLIRHTKYSHNPLSSN
jgi:hypothetical protein